MFKYLIALWFVFILILAGCIPTSDNQQIKDVTNTFWQHVVEREVLSSSALVTTDSRAFLPLLNNKKLAIQHYEIGEIQINGTQAEVAVQLFRGDKADMHIPVRTVLVKSTDAWQIDVQKTMSSMVNGTMNSVVEQLNVFMQQEAESLAVPNSPEIQKLNQKLNQGVKQFDSTLKQSK